VTQALDYAPMLSRPSVSLRRVVLWIVYYACYAAGMVVPATVGLIVLIESRWLDQPRDEYFVIALAVGAAGGAAIAYFLRRLRRPHVAPIVLGVPAAALGLLMTCVVYFTTRGFEQAFGLLLFGSIAATGFVLCAAGAMGLRLNRRPADPKP
jgi:peptidoglycan/LPS O-acetylase OafA/YrhL